MLVCRFNTYPNFSLLEEAISSDIRYSQCLFLVYGKGQGLSFDLNLGSKDSVTHPLFLTFRCNWAAPSATPSVLGLSTIPDSPAFPMLLLFLSSSDKLALIHVALVPGPVGSPGWIGFLPPTVSFFPKIRFGLEGSRLLLITSTGLSSWGSSEISPVERAFSLPFSLHANLFGCSLELSL